MLGARVLGEFGEDPNRCVDAKARRLRQHLADHRRIQQAPLRESPLGRQRPLEGRLLLWAFAALTASPGARRYYDALRGRGKGHDAALRTLANRLVGILDGCLRHRSAYDEQVASATPSQGPRRPTQPRPTNRGHFESD